MGVQSPSKTKDQNMKTVCISLLMAGTAFAQTVQQTGPWVRVPNDYNPNQPPAYQTQQRNPFDVGIQGGAQADILPLIKWGVGAVIIMLILSTTLSLGKKLWPRMMDLPVIEEARSLGEMSTLAKFAFEAFDKFQELNNN